MTWVSADFRRVRAWLVTGFLNSNKKVVALCTQIYNKIQEENKLCLNDESQKDEASKDPRFVKMKKVKVKKEE